MQNLECNATKLVFSEVSSFKVNSVLDEHKIIKCVFNALSSLHCHFLWNTHGHLTTEYEIERRWRGPLYHMIRSTIWLYMLWKWYFIWKRSLMYNNRAYNNLFWIFLIQMEYPSEKHVYTYGRAGRVSCISLLFYTPWF